jgi:Tol biopolymer transport system component
VATVRVRVSPSRHAFTVTRLAAGSRTTSATSPTRPSNANVALFVVNVDGSGLRRITPWGFSDDDGSWSPDGTKIAFEHFGALYMVHPNGTGLTKVRLAIGEKSFAGDLRGRPERWRCLPWC